MSEPDAAFASRRLLMVDADTQLVRAWQRLLTEHHLEVSAAHSLASAIEALERSRDDRFDFLILDLALPDGDGLDLIPFVENFCATTRIAVVTSRLDSSAAIALFGHCEIVVPKPLGCDALLHVLRILDMASHEKYVADFARRHRCSARETQLLLAAVQGMNNDEAASLLGCDRSTVGTYWSRIFKKTATHSQRDVMALLIRSAQSRGAIVAKLLAPFVQMCCLLDGLGADLESILSIAPTLC